MRKTEYAASIDITYRALANYISGAREPKKDILTKLAKSFNVSPDVLTDDSVSLKLSREEEFLRRAGGRLRDRTHAIEYLEQSRGLFAGNSLSDDDKEALFACLEEIYFDAKKSAKKYGKK